jgi:Tfp pilus assembly protein PilP
MRVGEPALKGVERKWRSGPWRGSAAAALCTLRVAAAYNLRAALLGTMKRNGETEGVLSVGDKTQHVHVGQYIGQNDGRIVRIGDQELTVRELVREGTIEWKEKMTTLKVQESAQ